MSGFPRPAELLERYALVIIGVAIFVFFAVNSNTPQFDTSANIKNILSGEAALGILVIATLVPLVVGQIDLSIGPAAGLCSLLCAGMMSKTGLPLVPAILIAVGAGAAVGAINGLLVAGIGMNSIVATLGTSSILSALVLWYSGGQSIISGISPKLTNVGSAQWLGLPEPFWVLLVVVVVAWYVLEQTPLGRNLYASGSSPRASELVGLPVRRLIFSSFVAGGALAGFAGVLLVAVQGGGNPQLGQSFTLPALAAVFLGATTIKPGRYNVTGAVVAIFLVAFSVNGLTLLGAEAWVNDAFNGVALLVGVGVSVLSGKRRERARPSAADGADEPGSIPPAETRDGGRPDVSVAASMSPRNHNQSGRKI
jgi:ribose transport system permease protein